MIQITPADGRALVRLLGILQAGLESAIDTATPPSGSAQVLNAVERQCLIADQRNWNRAEALVKRLDRALRRVSEINRTFCVKLRRMGFRRIYRTEAGGELMVEYTRQVDARRLVTVQLWGSGHHRASSEFLGCADTAPTAFTDIPGLEAAVEHESTRLDSRWALPGTLATEQTTGAAQ